MADREAVSVETWNSVYVEFRGEMTGKARRLLADAGIPASRLDAEDVVHDAFAKVLRAPRAAEDPRAYLYAVIRREVAAEASRCGTPVERREEAGRRGTAVERRENAGRHGTPVERRADADRRGSAAVVAAPRSGALPAGEPAMADFSDMVAHRIAVHQALSALPPQQRAAVWATKALGRTQQETARDMGRSAGTVATHVARAVACLRLNLVGVWAAAVTLLCCLTGTVAARVTGVGGKDRAPAHLRLPDPGLSSGQAMLLGAVLLPLVFYLSASALSRLKTRLGSFG
jgi:RNA polymerase sigma factor (sigma-70 family)